MLAPKAFVRETRTPILCRVSTRVAIMAILIVGLSVASALWVNTQPMNAIVGSSVPQGPIIVDTIRPAVESLLSANGQRFNAGRCESTGQPNEFVAYGRASGNEFHEVFFVNLATGSHERLWKGLVPFQKGPVTLKVEGGSWSLAVDGQHVTGEWTRHS